MAAIQMDDNRRVVAIANLRAMCERVSGTCHRFTLDVGSRVVTVRYSNPDEWGKDRPIAITLPIVGAIPKDDPDGAAVLLDPAFIGKVGGSGVGTWHGEEWQAFDPVFYCPQLWRDPVDGRWYSNEDLAKRKTEQPSQEAAAK